MIRKLFFVTLVCIVFSNLLISQPRQDSLINFDWKFIQKPLADAHLFSYDDADWLIVQLPHDASINGPFIQDSLNSDKKNGFRPRLKGWYRKAFSLDDVLENKRYFLHFEGVYRDAKVYFNEKQVTHQLNGYDGFEVEVTGLIKAGENLIAVYYDNTDKESSRWYNGEGIYRDVWLKERNSSYVTNDGVYVTTPFVGSNLAKVDIQTEVLNDQEKEQEVLLRSAIHDPQGTPVSETTSVVPVASGEVYTFDQSLKVATPQLWDLDDPNLYTLKSTVSIGGRIVDQVSTTFGIRKIAFDANQGFLLNDEKVLVKGVNIHHDLGPLGAAAFERGFERRLEGLKKLGCNAVRLAHNPHDAFILDWCDRNGMLVFDEAFDKWDDQFFGAGNDFAAHWKSSLTTFIRRDRNHPSVFLWSVGNETRQQRDPKANFGIDLMKEMADFVHKLEPSRMVTCGLHPSRESGAYRTENYYREGPPEMEFYMDVVSTNYREEFWPVDRAKYPQLTFILSEAQVGNLGNEWFNFNHDKSVGLFYWGGTDYIGESFGWPAKGWPNGVIDWNDHWKPFSYYIHSLYSEDPMVYLAAYDPREETNKYWNEVNLRFQPMFSHWNWQGKDSVRLITFTNAEEVELLINGKSVGVKQVPQEYYTKDIKAHTASEFDPDDPVLTGPELHKELEWVVPYAPGSLRALAKIGGQVVAEYAVKTSGPPVRVVLEPDRKVIQADGLDLSYLTVKVVDEQGNLVPDADHLVSFEVSGAGVNAGVGSADVISNEPFQADQRSVFQGKALLIVRSGREQGTIKIKAKAKGLKAAQTEIQVVEE